MGIEKRWGLVRDDGQSELPKRKSRVKMNKSSLWLYTGRERAQGHRREKNIDRRFFRTGDRRGEKEFWQHREKGKHATEEGEQQKSEDGLVKTSRISGGGGTPRPEDKYPWKEGIARKENVCGGQANHGWGLKSWESIGEGTAKGQNLHCRDSEGGKLPAAKRVALIRPMSR